MINIVYCYVYSDDNKAFLDFLPTIGRISVAIINNNLRLDDCNFQDFLTEVHSIEGVDLYLDVHSNNSEDYHALSPDNIELIEYLTILPADKYVISDMNFKTLDCLINKGIQREDIYFEYKIDSSIYDVFKTKCKLEHSYIHAEIGEETLLQEISNSLCNIAFKPALLSSTKVGKYIANCGSERSTVFFSKGEYEMLEMLRQRYGIDYFGELLDSFESLGVKNIFVPYTNGLYKTSYRNDVIAHTAKLQSIVDLVNENQYSISNTSDYLELEKGSEANIICCPGSICPHVKINVKKMAEKLAEYIDDTKIVINGCRERCIKNECDLEIICTLGGPSILKHSDDNRICKVERQIFDVFEEERQRIVRR